jgi:hypothetical protein
MGLVPDFAGAQSGLRLLHDICLANVNTVVNGDAILRCSNANGRRSSESANMSVLTRFKSNEKLQAEALDILMEMIRRDLLTAEVHILDPECALVCNILDAFPTGSRDATMERVLNSYMTGVLSKRKGGPGITLTINQQFRLPPKAEAEVRASMAASKRP